MRAPRVNHHSVGIPRWLVVVFALSCGIGVANIYFPQAITPSIASAFATTPETTALIVTACQLGYAAGLLLIIPLADQLSARVLVPTLFFIAAVSLLVAGLAQSLPLLLAATLCVGISTVAPQAIVPIAAGLASPQQRSVVTGQITAGIGAGILLARVFSGVVASWWGWRAPYFVASLLAAALAVTLLVTLPHQGKICRGNGEKYLPLILSPLRLFCTQPQLRRSCYYQASVFAAFSAAWTALALYVTGPHFGYSTAMVSAIALAGAVSLVVAPVAGKLVGSRGSDYVTTLSLGATLLAGLILSGGLLPGPAGLLLLVAGVLVLDASVPIGQVANQLRIFAIEPTARARSNTAYMTSTFVGGAVGSLVGVNLFHYAGWIGVCALVTMTGAIALLGHCRTRQRQEEL